MSKAPIEILLDQVEWKEEPPAATEGGWPYVTHSGILKLGEGMEFEVKQLSTGQRIVIEESLLKFFQFLNGDE